MSFLQTILIYYSIQLTIQNSNPSSLKTKIDTNFVSIGLQVYEISDFDRNKDFTHAKSKHKRGILDVQVKFLEQTGIKVIPIVPNGNDQELYQILDKVSGVLFPGNDNDPIDEHGVASTEAEQMFKILDQSKEKKNNNVDFPIMGICQGMETIAIWECRNAKTPLTSCLTRKSQFNDTFDLVFNETTDVKQRHKSFQSLINKNLLKSVRRKVFFHYHNLAITNKLFNESSQLNSNFDILGWSHLNGREMSDSKDPVDDSKSIDEANVAIIHHKKQKIFGIQFHPEKGQFNLNTIFNTTYSKTVIKFAQAVAEQFSDICRKHPVENLNVQKELIERNEYIVNKDTNDGMQVFQD